MTTWILALPSCNTRWSNLQLQQGAGVAVSTCKFISIQKLFVILFSLTNYKWTYISMIWTTSKDKSLFVKGKNSFLLAWVLSKITVGEGTVSLTTVSHQRASEMLLASVLRSSYVWTEICLWLGETSAWIQKLILQLRFLCTPVKAVAATDMNSIRWLSQVSVDLLLLF